MKSKFIPLILILIFLITFVIFFKGLKNSNIYTPDTNLKKEVPLFELKSFENNSIIISEKIFEDNKYYLMNIWASWCIPCCLLYTSPSPRDNRTSRMPSSA